MRFQGWNNQQKLSHFFSLPNEIFLLGLAHGELAVYCYLKYLENRKTHQCWPSYRNIGKAVGMSENTVRKYVAMLEEHGLITTAYTIMCARDGAAHERTSDVYHLSVPRGGRHALPHSDGNLELQNQRMHVAELTLRNGGMEQ